MHPLHPYDGEYFIYSRFVQQSNKRILQVHDPCTSILSAAAVGGLGFEFYVFVVGWSLVRRSD